MVHILCGVTVDKTAQLADWRKRPLHPDLLKYAACDSFYLLKSWHQLKTYFGPSLKSFLWVKSKQACLNLYQFPPAPSSSKAWKKINSSLSNDLQLIFDTQENLYLFNQLWEWRASWSKLLDISPRSLVFDNTLAFIGRARPKSSLSLQPIWYTISRWPTQCVDHFLDYINTQGIYSLTRSKLYGGP